MTDRQSHVLTFIEEYHTLNGRVPAYREIGDALKLGPTQVSKCIQALVKQRKLQRTRLGFEVKR